MLISIGRTPENEISCRPIQKKRNESFAPTTYEFTAELLRKNWPPCRNQNYKFVGACSQQTSYADFYRADARKWNKLSGNTEKQKWKLRSDNLWIYGGTVAKEEADARKWNKLSANTEKEKWKLRPDNLWIIGGTVAKEEADARKWNKQYKFI